MIRIRGRTQLVKKICLTDMGRNPVAVRWVTSLSSRLASKIRSVLKRVLPIWKLDRIVWLFQIWSKRPDFQEQLEDIDYKLTKFDHVEGIKEA